LAARLSDGDGIPAPHMGAVPRGHILVRAGMDLAYKLALWDAMRATGTSRSALARALGLDEKEVRRMLDPAAKVKLPRVEAALRKLGAKPTRVVFDLPRAA
jgi:antitoxin HicB